MKQNLMIVANHIEYIEKMCDDLHHKKMGVVHFDSAQNAEAGLLLYGPAFVLLDSDIYGSNRLLGEIRNNFVPAPYIIIASTFSSSKERAMMYRQGADACIERPITADEVLALIEAVQRRERLDAHPPSDDRRFKMKYKELTIDTLHRNVTMRGIPIALTRKEYDVLCVLARHAGTVLTKEEIYTAVWKDRYDPQMTNVSDQISSLRHKLGLVSKDTSYIQTVFGVGYRFGSLI